MMAVMLKYDQGCFATTWIESFERLFDEKDQAYSTLEDDLNETFLSFNLIKECLSKALGGKPFIEYSEVTSISFTLENALVFFVSADNTERLIK